MKKYVSLKNELIELQKSLIETPEQGILLGEDIYKIKLGVKSKGRGKSGGVRIITFADTENIEQYEIEFLLTEIEFDEE